MRTTSSWQSLVNIAWMCSRAAMPKKKRFFPLALFRRVDASIFAHVRQRRKPRRRLDSGRFGFPNGTAVATPRTAGVKRPTKCLGNGGQGTPGVRSEATVAGTRRLRDYRPFIVSLTNGSIDSDHAQRHIGSVQCQHFVLIERQRASPPGVIRQATPHLRLSSSSILFLANSPSRSVAAAVRASMTANRTTLESQREGAATRHASTCFA
jgi:hypothetical protein